MQCRGSTLEPSACVEKEEKGVTNEGMIRSSENRVELKLRLGKVVASSMQETRGMLSDSTERGSLPVGDSRGRRKESREDRKIPHAPE